LHRIRTEDRPFAYHPLGESDYLSITPAAVPQGFIRKEFAMTKHPAARKNRRLLSIVPVTLSSIVLIASLASAPSHAQSSAAPGVAAQAATDSVTKTDAAKKSAPTANPGPFTDDLLGATPSIRLPAARNAKAGEPRTVTTEQTAVRTTPRSLAQ
jgi:hypothetical protein